MSKKTIVGEGYVRPEYFFWCAFLLAFVLWYHGGEATVAPQSSTAVAALVSFANPFEGVPLAAQAAFVYDVKTGKALFEKEADTILPLASLAKIMTAFTALSLIPETTLVTIGEDAIRQEGDSKFISGEQWLLRDLLRFMLVESSNDAAYAVALEAGMVAHGEENKEAGRRFFIEEMNRQASSLGLKSAQFFNESGLDVEEETKPGALASARDVAYLLIQAFEKFPEIFTATRLDTLAFQEGDSPVRNAENTNRDIGRFPLLLASKTGFTDLAGGNLAILFDAGFDRPIAVVIMGSTEQERFTDAGTLVWAALELLAQH